MRPLRYRPSHSLPRMKGRVRVGAHADAVIE
jgi:hypothetical protein